MALEQIRFRIFERKALYPLYCCYAMYAPRASSYCGIPVYGIYERKSKSFFKKIIEKTKNASEAHSQNDTPHNASFLL